MKYEKFILSLLTSLAIKKQNKGYYVISDEVEEVYAKARAFDEISDVIKKEDFYDRDTALNIIEILDELEGLI